MGKWHHHWLYVCEVCIEYVNIEIFVRKSRKKRETYSSSQCVSWHIRHTRAHYTWWASWWPVDRPRDTRIRDRQSWMDTRWLCRTRWWIRRADSLCWKSPRLHVRGLVGSYTQRRVPHQTENEWENTQLLTASHSLISSPLGSITACRRSPDPRVARAVALSCAAFSPRCFLMFLTVLLRSPPPLYLSRQGWWWWWMKSITMGRWWCTRQ